VLALGAICAAQTLPDTPSTAAYRQTALGFSGSPVRNIQQLSNLEPLPTAALTDGQKFKIFVSHAQSPLMFAGVGVNAALLRSRDNTDQRWSWPRTYTAALAERESNAFFGRYLFPVLFDQDPRYHGSDSDGVMPRAMYATSRVFITRRDDGRRTLNTSYLLSTLLTSSLANVYKHPWDRTPGNTFADMGSQIGSDAGMNLAREFWPQLRETLSGHTPKMFKKLKNKFAPDDNEKEPSKSSVFSNQHSVNAQFVR
jgi:hypothetical protein